MKTNKDALEVMYTHVLFIFAQTFADVSGYCYMHVCTEMVCMEIICKMSKLKLKDSHEFKIEQVSW